MKKQLLLFIVFLGYFGISFSNDFDPDTSLIAKSMITNPSGNKDICVVFYVGANQIARFEKTYKQLRSKGCYKGDVTLIICDDLEISELRKLPQFNKLNIVKFKSIKPADQSYKTYKNQHYTHVLKYRINKLHAFHEFFKQWNFIFYIDCGMRFFRPIQSIINLKKKGTLLAHSDAHPHYKWKLRDQFNKTYDPICYNKLKNTYNLNEDYPQSTIMLFDTSLINKNTVSDIISLIYKFPIAVNVDQPYIALYFTQIHKVWKQLPIKNRKNLYYYDITSRNSSFKYIMLKY